jgi:pyrimidine-specific ribonucleoside hydrolase
MPLPSILSVGLGFALLALLHVESATSGSSSGQDMNGQIPIIVDTDMGTDDWLALSYVASSTKANLLGVTIVGSGLAPCDEGVRNARYLLGLSLENADRPVGCGSTWPMDGYASYPQTWRRNAADMMGESALLPQYEANFVDGPTLLADLLVSSSEPVLILAIGSMTNVATVLKLSPHLKKKVKAVVSMGGAVHVEGNLRVPGFTDTLRNTKAEWNYYIDPVAAKIVFESGVPIKLVPLDATNKLPLTEVFIRRTEQLRKTALGAFVNRTFTWISQSVNNGEYYHWDPLTAVISLNPDLCNKVERLHLVVITDAGSDTGVSSGQPMRLFPYSSFDGKRRKPLNHNAAGATVLSLMGTSVDVCLLADAVAYEDHFLTTLGADLASPSQSQ